MSIEPEVNETKASTWESEGTEEHKVNAGPAESSYSMVYSPGETRVNVSRTVNTGPSHGQYSYVQP